jgi:hypothetical protein
VVFGRLRADVNSKVRSDFILSEYPTLLIFKDEKLVGRYEGNLARPNLDEFILRKI